MALIILASVALRVRSAHGTFVAPDEAIVLGISAGRGPAEIWAASLSNPHPPLVYLVLSAWLQVGRGDLWVRMLPTLLTAAGLVLLWRTGKALAGRTRSLVAVALVAGSPSLVPATTEVRPYPLLFFLAAASIEALRRSTGSALEGRRAAALSFAALSGLMVASHYSAALLLVGLFPWAVARTSRNMPGVGDRAFALASWSVPAATLGLFWIGHISHQVSAGLAGHLLGGIYSGGLHGPGSGGVLPFVARSSWRLLRWFGGALSAILAIALAAGLVNLARRKGGDALLVLGPLMAGVAAALVGRYPYGGFRQSTYLIIPLAIGIAAGVPAAFLRHRVRVTAVVMLLLSSVVLFGPDRAPSGQPKRAQRRLDLDTAIASVDSGARAHPIVLVDLSSSVVLGWYRGEPGVDYWKPGASLPLDVDMRGLRVRIGGFWSYDVDSLRRDLAVVRGETREHLPIHILAIWPKRDLAGHLHDRAAPTAGGAPLDWFGEGVLTAPLP